MSFLFRGLECKSRKSRDTWINRQIWPWSTKWSRAKANTVLSREWKHSLPKTKEIALNMDITRWSVQKPDWLYSLQLKIEKLYIISKTRPGAACGWNHELLIVIFRLKLKKIGKTTRPFRYYINEIPYNCTVEVTNRFKGLDLIQCLKNYGWRLLTLYKRWWSKPCQRKRNAKKQNDCLRLRQIAGKRREAKGKGERERYTHLLI